MEHILIVDPGDALRDTVPAETTRKKHRPLAPPVGARVASAKSKGFPQPAIGAGPLPPPIGLSSSSSSTQPPTVFVGTKGFGKDSNYGIEIPPPVSIPWPGLPDFAAPAAVSDHVATSEPIFGLGVSMPPEPIPALSEEIEQWMEENFKAMHFSNRTPPEVGEDVLWRGAIVGKRGMPSTKVEYFNGTVRALWVDPEHELWVYVD